jgi:hypothetical protein
MENTYYNHPRKPHYHPDEALPSEGLSFIHPKHLDWWMLRGELGNGPKEGGFQILGKVVVQGDEFSPN